MADWWEFIAAAEGSSGCPKANLSPIGRVCTLCFFWVLPLLNLASVSVDITCDSVGIGATKH